LGVTWVYALSLKFRAQIASHLNSKFCQFYHRFTSWRDEKAFRLEKDCYQNDNGDLFSNI
ncbi:TPA: hypothetical protein ACX6NV_000817, partial [Photobacterium damselae]|uniref:hypothetical protein n=1 Tax=Photobacterium damselae TaxID=38293 RepID=UPI00370B8763